MKTFFTLFVLLFSSSMLADDISDFQIEGMNIGDSLLNFYSKTEIDSWEKLYRVDVKKKDFYQVTTDKLLNNIYDYFLFNLKNNDSKYIIYSVRGGKLFENNFDECLKLKNEIVNEFKTLIDSKTSTYEYNYDNVDDGKSVAYVTDFNIKNGNIRVYCVNWSKITEDKRNWDDNFSVQINSKEYDNWLKKISK